MSLLLGGALRVGIRVWNPLETLLYTLLETLYPDSQADVGHARAGPPL